MDKSTIKTLLESQERAYKSAMDVVVKQMNNRIAALESTVKDLTTSLEFTQRELDELKSTTRENENENQATKVKMNQQTALVDSSKSQIESLQERCNYMEDYSRRNNIRISGVKERNGETWEQTAALVSTVLGEKMQLSDLELDRAHRIGQHQDAKPRTIVARFSRYCDREAVMRSARKLRGTNIYINDDLCAASQAIKNAQMPQLKQAKAQGKIAFFRHTKLIIKDKPARGHGDDRDRAPAAAAAAMMVEGASAGSAVGTGRPGVGGEAPEFPPLTHRLPASSPSAARPPVTRPNTRGSIRK